MRKFRVQCDCGNKHDCKLCNGTGVTTILVSDNSTPANVIEELEVTEKDKQFLDGIIKKIFTDFDKSIEEFNEGCVNGA